MAFDIKKLVGVAACIVAFGGAAQAITLDAGSFVCEGPDSLLPDAPDCNGTNTFGDGGQNSGPTVTLSFSGSGEAHIFGGIRGKNANKYLDVFTIEGDGKYRLTLEAIGYTNSNGSPNPNAPFDATWTMGSGVTEEVVGTINNQSDPTVELLSGVFDLTGGSLFTLDASGGDFTGGKVMEYKVTVSAVPLPAGVLLLLSGLGGLAFMRRRTTA